VAVSFPKPRGRTALWVNPSLRLGLPGFARLTKKPLPLPLPCLRQVLPGKARLGFNLAFNLALPGKGKGCRVLPGKARLGFNLAFNLALPGKGKGWQGFFLAVFKFQIWIPSLFYGLGCSAPK